jgi:hypothetical protein
VEGESRRFAALQALLLQAQDGQDIFAAVVLENFPLRQLLCVLLSTCSALVLVGNDVQGVIDLTMRGLPFAPSYS